MTVGYETLALASEDGTRIHAHRWAPPSPRGSVLVVPGYADHGGRYREVAHALCARGLEVVAVDLRGHGRSDGRRGHVLSFEEYLDDVEAARRALAPGPHVFLGHSMGGVVLLLYLWRRGVVPHGVILTNPFLALSMPVPGYKVLLARAAARAYPALAIPSGLQPSAMSHDAAMVHSYATDPLVFRTATAGWFAEVQRVQREIWGMPPLTSDLLYIYGDADPVADPAQHARFGAHLQARSKTVVLRPGEFHEVLNETGRAELHAQVADWAFGRVAA